MCLVLDASRVSVRHWLLHGSISWSARLERRKYEPIPKGRRSSALRNEPPYADSWTSYGSGYRGATIGPRADKYYLPILPCTDPDTCDSPKFYQDTHNCPSALPFWMLALCVCAILHGQLSSCKSPLSPLWLFPG